MPKVSVFIFCSDVQGNFTSHRKVNVTSVIPESVKRTSMARANGCLMRNSHKYFESLFKHFCIWLRFNQGQTVFIFLPYFF